VLPRFAAAWAAAAGTRRKAKRADAARRMQNVGEFLVTMQNLLCGRDRRHPTLRVYDLCRQEGSDSRSLGRVNEARRKEKAPTPGPSRFSLKSSAYASTW
jgi:hypothetical protein